MKKVLAICLGIVAVIILSAPGYPDQDSRDQSREKKLFQNYAGYGSASVSSCCIEGYVFVIMTGNISNYTSIVQVYEEKDGKAVPKRCE